MPKRFDQKKKRRDWRWYANVVISVIVALSMVLGTVAVFTGMGTPSAPPPPPTLDVPTLAPTPLPSTPTPTPRASIDYLITSASDFLDRAIL